MHAYASDITNTQFMMYLPNSSIDGTRRFLDWAIAEWCKSDQKSYEFAVTLDGKHIGAVSIGLDDNGQYQFQFKTWSDKFLPKRTQCFKRAALAETQTVHDFKWKWYKAAVWAG